MPCTARVSADGYPVMTALDHIQHANDEVSLREITFATVRDILSLNVDASQRAYVASNATSIAEGHFNPGAWFRGVYAAETPVGFIMLLDPEVPDAILRGPSIGPEKCCFGA